LAAEPNEARTLDRRAFLRRAGATALVAPAVPFLACGVDSAPGSSHRASVPEHPGGDITRPILLRWSDGAVHLDAPAQELPVAYVSMGRKQLFVDHDYRDLVYWDLRAHISVSTGVWRIPLRGDPLNMAIVPGDLDREFEELSERDWDPTLPPSLGDIRILRGVAMSRRIDLTCAPLSGGGAWFQAGPWEIQQCWGPSDQLCREDFMSVGTGTRYADRECTQPEGAVDVLTWAATAAPSAV
jgi:hypothetical protein